MLFYVITDSELEVTLYFRYETYTDITRYYNVANDLHRHSVVSNHYTLAVF